MATGTNYLASVISGILTVACGRTVDTPSLPSSADYFVDASRPDDSGDGLTLGTAKQTITAGIALMSAGETLEVKGGSYTEDITTWVNGSVGAGYSVIRNTAGERPIITGITSWASNSYIDFDGFKVIHSNAINGLNSSGLDAGNNIRIFNTAYEGGPLTANSYTFALGGQCSNILVEDCWFYGPGGRQNFLNYEVSQVTLRRVVIRHDLGWDTIVKPDPEGCGTVYDSSNVRLQNVIIIDSALNPANTAQGSEWAGAFTMTNNNAQSNAMQDNTVDGCMVINVDGNAFEHGGGTGDVLNTQFQDVFCGFGDSFSGENGPGGVFSMNNPNNKECFGERMTMHRYSIAQAMYNGGGSNVNSLRNSIVHDMIDNTVGSATGGAMTNEYNNAFNNANENSGALGLVTTDPELNGLLYPVRIEAASNLLTSGESGGQQGATILKRIGVSGSVHGDAGVDTVTTDDLWPWPNEALIKADMAAISTRGFCGGNSLDATPQTLTKYVWEYYGNQIPAGVY